MRKNTKIIRYFKRKLYRGRTLFARAVDFFALRLITLAACYLWFTSIIDNTVIAAVLSFTALVAASVAAELYKSIKLEKFIKNERVHIKAQLFHEKLLIMSKDDFLDVIRGYLKAHPDKFSGNCLIYTSQSATPVSTDTVLAAYRLALRRGLNSAAIFSASSVSDEARSIAERYTDVKLEFASPDAITKHCKEIGILATDEMVDDTILALISAESEARRKKFRQPFAPTKTHRYILVAVGLFIMSFFVNYALYYRLLSAACLSFGAFAWWLSNASPNSNANEKAQ